MDFGVIVSKSVLLFISLLFWIPFLMCQKCRVYLCEEPQGNTLSFLGGQKNEQTVQLTTSLDVVKMFGRQLHQPQGPWESLQDCNMLGKASVEKCSKGASAGLFYVGAHVLNAYKEYDPFLQNRDAFLPPIIIIVVAVVMLVIGIVGCCATLRESKIGLGVFLVIIVLVFSAEMAAFVLGFVYKGKIIAEVHDSMSKAFAAYDGESEHSRSVNYLQQELQCCGVQNYTDWIGTQWFNTKGNHTLPLSCCKQGPAFENCTGQLSEKHLFNTQGCEKMMDLGQLLNYAMLIVLGFAIVKFFGMLGVCVIACKKESQGYQSLSTGVFA